MPDIRNIINPHRNCGKDAQLAAIHADSAKMDWPVGEIYCQTATGRQTDTAIRSGRAESKSIIRAMHLFNLARIDGSTAEKRADIQARIRTIHKRGCVFREASTGLQSNDRDALMEMTLRAVRMITDYGKGAAGQTRVGRPPKPRTEADIEVMRRLWESRKLTTIQDVLDAAKAKGLKRFNKAEFYVRFGKRNP